MDSLIVVVELSSDSTAIEVVGIKVVHTTMHKRKKLMH